VPIHKEKQGNASDISQILRTLSSIYGKLFDKFVLCHFSDSLISSELQFGFRVKSSSNLRSMVLNESLAYYARHLSSVFCAFLDATKAFERIRYCKLFKLLISRQVPAPKIRVLINF